MMPWASSAAAPLDGSSGLLVEDSLHRTAAPPRDPQILVEECLPRVLLVSKPAGEHLLLLRGGRNRFRVKPTVDLERVLDVGEEDECLPQREGHGVLDQA